MVSIVIDNNDNMVVVEEMRRMTSTSVRDIMHRSEKIENTNQKGNIAL